MNPLYKPRPAIKDALKGIDMTAGDFARRSGYVPSTFRAKMSGDAPMDAVEEAKVLADIEAMKEIA